MKKATKLTWKRARDAFIASLIAMSWIAASGCVGVRDQLFQPLPTPSPLGTSAVIAHPQSPIRVPSGPRPTPPADAEAGAEMAPREAIPPPPSTKLKVEPLEDAEELLLELEDIEPTPMPLEQRQRRRGAPLRSPFAPVVLEWRG